jgi:hypothetical protein
VSVRSWNRIGAGSGIAFAVLVPVGFSVAFAGSTLTDLGSSSATIAKAFASPAPTRLWVGEYVEVIALLLFVVFAARVRTSLQRVEGEAGWLSATAFGVALVFAATSMVSFATTGAAYYRAGHGIDLQVARALTDIGSFEQTINSGVIGIFLAATAASILSRRAFNRWFGWTAAVLAAIFFVAMALPKSGIAVAPQLLFSVWAIALSIAMLREVEPPVVRGMRPQQD